MSEIASPGFGASQASPLCEGDWVRALTLAERRRLVRARVSDPHRTARARARLERWKSQPPFATGDWFARKLSAEAIDEDMLLAILATDDTDLEAAQTETPRWLAQIQEAYAQPEHHESLAEVFAADPEYGFLHWIAPLVIRARSRLEDEIGRLRAGFEDMLPEEAARLFFAPLPDHLLWMIDRTAVLELNVARVEGRLAGETPEQRFRSFIERLQRTDVALELLREYPVLARAVVEHLDAWVETSRELLERLRADSGEIRRMFFAEGDPGKLTGLETGAGDSHRGGRSVALLTFASGARLVYKPRPVACERHFQELLSWLEGHGAPERLRTLLVLDRDDYGWVEFVRARSCARREELTAYHRRLGSLLAILHMAGAVDFHFQNLVAAGDQPVAVDLESLFHPTPPLAESAPAEDRLTAKALGESVLRVGLLPFRVGEAPEGARPDWSGVASVAGQSAPDAALGWEASGTDEMRATRKPFAVEGGDNRPSFQGEEADVADYIDPLLEGFEDMSRWIARHRLELSAPDGPLTLMASDRVRVVLRASRAYGLLLENSWHPDFLRDALERERFLDRVWVGAEAMPVWERVAVHERRELAAGDLPYFESQPASRHLRTSTGELLENVFSESALDAARRRLSHASEEEIGRQAWLARVSLGTLLLNRHQGEWEEYEIVDPGARAGDDLRRQGIDASLALGHWFERMAVREESDATWITLDLRQGIWALFPSSEDLYAGIPGISLFLGYLAARADRPELAEPARAAMRTLLRRLEKNGESVRYIGLHQGWGGVLYVLAHLGTLWNESAWFDAGDRIVDHLLTRIDGDLDLDVVVGSAGTLLALLAFHRASGSARALDGARRCGERLLSQAIRTDEGIAWRTPIGGEDVQTGYAHGAAGMAAALVELTAATGEARYGHAALSAFAQERAVLWPELHRWLQAGRRSDARADMPADPSIALSWCYGAPGLGLSRLRALSVLDPTSVPLREDVDHAIRLTLERGFGKNQCLCHGDLGNLDFLLQAQALSPDLGERVASLSRGIVHDVRQGHWRCGTVAGIEAPGLMNGLAGIGLGLLRLADPSRVPSMLSADPPPAPGTE